MALIVAAAVVVIVVALRWVVGLYDRKRIRAELHGGGLATVDIQWTPFASGWLQSPGNRHYNVIYAAPDDHTLRATCSVDLFQGVIWTKDTPLFFSDSDGPRKSITKHCSVCDTPLESHWMKCPKCGEEVYQRGKAYVGK